LKNQLVRVWIILILAMVGSFARAGGESCALAVRDVTVGQTTTLGLPKVFVNPTARLPMGGMSLLGQNYYRVSVHESRFAYFSAPEYAGRQRQQNWCWAACIQMVLNYHGLRVSQEMIVQRVFGYLVDRPGGVPHFLTALNNWFPNLSGQFSLARAVLFDVQNNFMFLHLLAQGSTLIVGLRGDIPGASGHAYVLTGAVFSYDVFGRPSFIHSVTLRDPWPHNPSEITVPWAEFAKDFMMGFAIGVN
jgi:hypothetical protein